jgi:hypothetical protein
MNNPPSEDEEMRAVQRDKPLPGLHPTAAADNEIKTESPAERPPLGKGMLTFVASLLLVAITFSIGFSYLLQKRWFPSRTHSSASATSSVEPSIPGAPTPPLIPLNADMLNVSEIALGPPNLAVVNGKRLAEGEELVVVTPAGSATVRIEKIGDGVVQFGYGTEKIEAKLLAETVAQKTPPP